MRSFPTGGSEIGVVCTCVGGLLEHDGEVREVCWKLSGSGIRMRTILGAGLVVVSVVLVFSLTFCSHLFLQLMDDCQE